MNAVPMIENPTLEEIREYQGKIPCFELLEEVMSAEIAKGNRVVHIGDAGCHPSETAVILDFVEGPMCEYEGIKSYMYQERELYKYFVVGDNKGCLEFDFGRRKE